MNGPKCQTPAAAGAAHCKRCGSPLGGKAAAAKAPAASDEIDLMPLEESKTPAYSAYEPPPGLDLPGGPAPALKLGPKGGPSDGPPGPPSPEAIAKIRGANAAPPANPLTKFIGLGVVVVVLGLIAWLVLRTKNEIIVGKPKFEQPIMLGSNQVKVENIEVTGHFSYKLDVEILDGELLVGVVERSHKDSAKLADLKKHDLKSMKKGDKEEFTGDFKHKVQASWMFLNDSKKPAKARVKFQTAPQ
jgi:hypothetical protein